MLKFEVKFVNLSHQNPHLENVKSVTDDRSAPSPHSLLPRLLVEKFRFTAFATASRALRALARNKKKKYRALFFALKFEVKFANFSSNFTRRDPHLDNAKFEFSNLTHRLELVCFFVKGKA